MKLQEVKLANPGFFSEKVVGFFGDEYVWIDREGNTRVLKVQTKYGTCAVYEIHPQTKALSYLRHDDEL